ncbi:MAG TPA: hypothetical protein VHA82_02995 [Ramlibacter sp.]|uniref:hypothetical protein n=1 Tax=Ramlibacter sp. TaxID=1917967 RepID=UPI002C6CE31B|nr:hypothetical protein [Ramlibacter sp.]HVZ42752.1 hypothetical protein [Ramlibacter sp.]
MDFRALVRIAHHRRALLRHDRWTREQLISHQSRELASLREFACLKSAFYYRFHEGRADCPLEELPVLAREEFERGALDIETDRSATARVSHAVEAAVAAASRERVLAWAGLAPGFAQWFDPVRSTVYGAPAAGPYGGPYSASPRMRFRHLDAARPAADLSRELNDWQPAFIRTTADRALALAREQLDGALRITPAIVSLEGALLTPETRWIIEEAWGTAVFDAYTADGLGVLAAECAEHRGLHLCEDLNVIEIVDAEGHAVAPGVFGERVLVTSLYRRARPLIRYELRDRVRLAARACPCGRPFRLIDGLEPGPRGAR